MKYPWPACVRHVITEYETRLHPPEPQTSVSIPVLDGVSERWKSPPQATSLLVVEFMFQLAKGKVKIHISSEVPSPYGG
jgi:hypothetical protein